MSRKGKMPIVLPKDVEVTIQSNCFMAKGPKGSLSYMVVPGVMIVQEQDKLYVKIENESRKLNVMHGLYRALVLNMVVGVSKGFQKNLEMIGVGYRAVVQGDMLDVQVGFSHPTKLQIPNGIQVKVNKNTAIVIEGCNRQAVGQFAAEVRALRPPEPYKGKGIRYKEEYVRRKAGKAAKSVKKAG